MKRTLWKIVSIFLVCVLMLGGVFATSTFNDISTNDWYFSSVNFVKQSNIMSGVGDNIFDPSSTLTRAQMITTIIKAKGISIDSVTSPGFNDIYGHWAWKYITKGKELGLVYGVDSSGTLFSPDDPVTREQFLKVLSTICLKEPDQSKQMTFNDTWKISSWAYNYIDSAYKMGLIAGDTNNNMCPTDTVSRAEASMFLMKVFTDNEAPRITLTPQTSVYIDEGSTVSYSVDFSDNKGIKNIDFTTQNVSITGGTGNISITGSGNTRNITITNIATTQLSGDKLIYLNIAKGSVTDISNIYSSSTSTPILVTSKLEKKREAVKSEFGIDIYFGEDITADYVYNSFGIDQMQQFLNKDQTSAYIDNMITLFRQYPTQYFDEIVQNGGVMRYNIIKRFDGNILGLACTGAIGDYQVFLTTDDTTFNRTFYHETMHLTDYYMDDMTYWSDQFDTIPDSFYNWDSYRPSGFKYFNEYSYGDDYSTMYPLNKYVFGASNPNPIDWYFVTQYGKTNPYEDRAELMAENMNNAAQKSYHTQDNKILQKMTYLNSEIDRVFNSVTSSATEKWENLMP